jgi:hypothetical protein
MACSLRLVAEIKAEDKKLSLTPEENARRVNFNVTHFGLHGSFT